MTKEKHLRVSEIAKVQKSKTGWILFFLFLLFGIIVFALVRVIA